MEHYYINNNARHTKDYEIHKKDCVYFPAEWTYLGSFTSYDEALKIAKEKFSIICACTTCLAHVKQD